MSAATPLNGEGDLFALADGTVIVWERIPGDETSTAIAFFHSESNPSEPDSDPVLWISPGGWSPVSPTQAGINYPALALGTIHEIWAALLIRDVPIGPASEPEPDDPDTADAEYLRAMLSDPQPLTAYSGGSWPSVRVEALHAASRWLQPTPCRIVDVLTAADEFVAWIEGDREPLPPLIAAPGQGADITSDTAVTDDVKAVLKAFARDLTSVMEDNHLSSAEQIGTLDRIIGNWTAD